VYFASSVVPLFIFHPKKIRSARYPQITVARFHVLKGQQEIARGKQRAARPPR
jgi:hypothetical protein